MSIRLIAGLGNPGTPYSQTRHNVGTWALQQIAKDYHAILSEKQSFSGLYSKLRVHDTVCHLLIPMTFMNQSGRSVAALTRYYKIPLLDVLIIHDDLDLPPGVIRLKVGGGSGGHNGLKDIVSVCKDSNFLRLRIGIGHPGNKALVSNYVLSKPDGSEYSKIQVAIQKINTVLPLLLQGSTALAMQILHTSEQV